MGLVRSGAPGSAVGQLAAGNLAPCPGLQIAEHGGGSAGQDRGTVTLVLDATTANVAMFALAAHADEREAHVREVERSGRNLPEGSWGRRNRQAIAVRETRIAARLRAVEQACRTATGRDTGYAPEPARALRSAELQPGRQTGLEAEP
jgi:hypothetical protein